MSFVASEKEPGHSCLKSDPELYDVLLTVLSHGIHHPMSLHAFKPQKIYLIPTKCFNCSSTIYPLTDAAQCIRCSQYVHRACCNARNVNQICSQGWSDNVDNVIDDSSLSPLPLNNEKQIDCASAKPSASSTIQSGTFSHSNSNKECLFLHSPRTPPRLVVTLNIPQYYNSDTMPPPGSPHCLWKKCLQELSKDFYLTRMSSMPDSSYATEKIINRLLSDQTTFPGRVFKELRDVYMHITFSADCDYLLHAREALDNIACSVVSILPAEMGDDTDYLKMIVTVVDWRVLRQDDGSMYDKVFGAAQRIGTRMDNALLARLYQQQEQENDQFEEEVRRLQREKMIHEDTTARPKTPPPRVMDIPHYEDIHIKLGKIPGEYAVMDKLERLVETLKLIATSAPPKEEVQTSRGLHGDTSPDRSHNTSDLTLEQTMQNYDIDADSLMQKFCQILSHETLRYEFYWHAESVFIDHMCREYNWLLGAEGYALVTLQQALRCLCPALATASSGKSSTGGGSSSRCNKPTASLHSRSEDSRDRDHDDDNSVRSKYSSDDNKSDTLGISLHNNEALENSSNKLKGFSASKIKMIIPVQGSE